MALPEPEEENVLRLAEIAPPGRPEGNPARLAV